MRIHVFCTLSALASCAAFVAPKASKSLSSSAGASTLHVATISGEETRASDNILYRDRYDAMAWEKGFQNVEKEACYELDGDFPDDLVGTFFQNGHTKFYVSDDEFHVHPFDADGMIQAVTFGKSTAWFRNRYIETPGYLQELNENKVCKRGVFGTARNKGKWWSNIFDVDFKNVANTHVLFMGDDELYALWEAGAPFQIDPTTLETIEESTLYGAINDGDIANNRYAAHYKIDPIRQQVCGFSILPGDKDPANTHKICVMEHDRQEKQLLYQKTYPFDGLGVAHDCAVTENYFIFLQAPFEFKPIPLILGLKGAAECIIFDEEAEHGKMILIPRGDNQKEPIVIDVPTYFSFHTSNAFEDEEGNVILDMVVAKSDYKMLAMAGEETGYRKRPVWEGIDWAKDVPPNELLRVTLDPKKSKLVSQASLSPNCATIEFPVINPSRISQPYKYAYCATAAGASDMSPLQGIAKIDVETGTLLEKWLPEPDQYITEVAFCPKMGQASDKEDDGYLVTYLLDSNKKCNEVIVFDAESPGKGPIARAPLQGWCVNHSLHGTFVPGFTPDLSDEVKARFES
ncbi:MAG: hypothetical protein SGBAC_007147 [Bacillariaceae sp.]